MPILAGFDLAAATDTLVFTAPAGVMPTTVNALFCNRNAAGVAPVSLWAVPAGQALDPKWTLEAGTPLPAKAPLERGGIPLGVGDKVYARSETAGVNVVIVGMQ